MSEGVRDCKKFGNHCYSGSRNLQVCCWGVAIMFIGSSCGFFSGCYGVTKAR